MNYEDQIEAIMERFDWTKVYIAMKAVGWTWFDSYPNTPSINQLQETGRSLLSELAGEPSSTSISTGGFIARREEHDDMKFLLLEFVLTNAESEYED